MMESKAYNFHDIFCKGDSFSGVVIPKVQRDYAQGRTTDRVKRIREGFLEVLYEAVTGGQPVTLDFIYGNVENGNLIPLDGQQRLTTLFLLHYYVAQHEGIPDSERAFLKRFTYQTRVSSREFCKHLVDFKPDFGQETLSEQIKDEVWFLLEWESDPTVQSMLVMLDAIHEKFAATTGVWEKLTADAITFYFLPLEQMGVTDELYIKMNSRGKPLSTFEHFKAELEMRMKEVNEEIANRIATKIDREWTDLLWPYRDSGTGEEGKDELIDDEILRYLHFISDIISYREGHSEIKDDFDIIKQQFSVSCPDAEQNMLLLERWFDLWTIRNVRDFFESYVSREGYQAGKILIDKQGENDKLPDLFNECCRCYGGKVGQRPTFPLGRSILLYAFLIYMEHSEEVTDTDFRRRLRIVNNLVRNSANTLRSEYMKELLLQVDRIILTGVVEQVAEGKARFHSRQMEEEAEKLQWTSLNPGKAELLFKLEDHKYLNGYVDVVGLEHIDWCERFYSLFECDLGCINRALLATGDYFVKDEWRYQIGVSNTRTNLNVWRTLFGPNRKSEELKAALHHLLASRETFTDKDLKDVAWKYLQLSREMPVRYYLVKYSSMLPNRFGKYYWRNHQNQGRGSYKVIMMTTEFYFGFNYDIFLRTLYEIAGGKEAGLYVKDYAYTEYNNDGTAKLYMTRQGLYLTLDEDVYSVCNEQGEELESRKIQQNQLWIDTEDRVLVGLQLLNKYMHLYDENTIRGYVSRCEWTFAKTMPQWPHEYIIKGKCPLTKEEFEQFVWTQRTLGQYENWHAYRQPYLYIDGYKYWTMGCEIENTTCINRAKVE